MIRLVARQCPPQFLQTNFSLSTSSISGRKKAPEKGRKNADCRRKKNGLRAEYKKGSENKGMECGLGE